MAASVATRRGGDVRFDFENRKNSAERWAEKGSGAKASRHARVFEALLSQGFFFWLRGKKKRCFGLKNKSRSDPRAGQTVRPRRRRMT